MEEALIRRSMHREAAASKSKGVRDREMRMPWLPCRLLSSSPLDLPSRPLPLHGQRALCFPAPQAKGSSCFKSVPREKSMAGNRMTPPQINFGPGHYNISYEATDRHLESKDIKACALALVSLLAGRLLLF